MLRAIRPATQLLSTRAQSRLLHYRHHVSRSSGPTIAFQAQRSYANLKTTDSAVLPGSQSTSVSEDVPLPPTVTDSSPATPTDSSDVLIGNIPRTPPSPEEVGSALAESDASFENMPRPPPTPEEVGSSSVTTDTLHVPFASVPGTAALPQDVGSAFTTTTSSTDSALVTPSPVPISPTRTLASSTAITSPPPPPPPAAPLTVPKKPRRLFRRFVYLITFLGLSFAGGVSYSLVNDNFHDFFTEYVPYGEDAVLYFEEREFRRRFADRSRTSTRSMYPQVSGEKKVTISGNSGLAPRIAEAKASDSNTKGPHVSAVSSTGKAASPPAIPTDEPKKVEQAINVESSKSSTAPKVAAKKPEPAKPTVVNASDNAPLEIKAPAQSLAEAATPQPTLLAQPVIPIDPLKIDNAADPIVQEITKLVNDMVQLVNADGASDLYRGPMEKAKDSVQKLAADIDVYRRADSIAAEDQIKKEKAQFDQAALELVKRVREEQKEQELRWREEYETERKHLAQSYQDKLKAELELAEKVADQRRRNELLEQDLKMKESFVTSVRDRVETERSGRLSKLTELSSTVTELESLTSQWNEVVENNLKAQHILVAVEALRFILDDADRPTPFLNELVALKEVASDDAVINAAVASISPGSYQRGVPTSAQLVDRFRRVAAEVRKAALLPEDAGVASHAASFVLSKVMFKKNGLAVGEDVESILTRTETLLEEGDLDEAAREMNGLHGWAKVLSKDWLAECRTVLELRQAIDVIATQARLRGLMVE